MGVVVLFWSEISGVLRGPSGQCENAKWIMINGTCEYY